MRIDVMIPPDLTTSKASHHRPTSGAVFDDVYASLRHDDDASSARGTGAAPQQLFSFDALGILGVGGGGSSQSQAPRMPAAVEAVAASTKAHDPHGINTVQQALHNRDGGHYTGIGLSPHSPGNPGDWPAEASPSDAVPVAAFSPAEPSCCGDASAYRIMRSASPYSVSILPLAMNALSPLRPVSFGTMVPSILSPNQPNNASMGGAGAVPKNLLLRFESARHAQAVSDEVSVTVSETEGVLQVIAAAPELTDTARTKIRSLADDIAKDIGVTLGEFSLNGTLLPRASKFLDWRPSWQFQL